MMLNLVGPFVVNAPFGTEIAFAKGLRRLGHEVIEVDPNIDREMRGLRNDADATVVFKSCVGAERYLKSLRHPIVIYQPDDARFPHIREMMLMMREYATLFLSFDDHGAALAKSMGYRSAETLLLTADDELYCPSPTPIERDIDVSFIGSMGDPVAHASRRRMCDIVQREAARRGWKTFFGTTQDTSVIVDVYRRSRVVLNHATDVGQPFGYGYGLQCRHFEVGMAGAPLVSNMTYSGQGRPHMTSPSLPYVQFNCESGLLEAIDSCHENTEDFAWWLHKSVMEFHAPQHRAAQLIDFLQRSC